MSVIYIVGSLRNPEVPKVAAYLRTLGHEAFASWYAAGPIADDCWQAYEAARGLTYPEALKDWAAQHIFEFDYYHLNRADAAIIVLPTGVSGHLELGYFIGRGKPGYVLLPESGQINKLPPDWRWIAGLYEGEGSITCMKAHGKFYPRISIASTDKDVLDKVVTITGISKVSRPYTRASNRFGKKPIYFWQPGKLDDVVMIVRGIWQDLSLRRRAQVMKVFTKIGLGDDFKSQGKPPYEFRWDIMYSFAKGVYTNLKDLGEAL